MADGRSFVKGLRYNLGAEGALASATLTDCEGSAPLLFVVHAGIEDSGRYPQACDHSVPVWFWHPAIEAMPALPPRQRHPTRATDSGVECRRATPAEIAREAEAAGVWATVEPYVTALTSDA